MVLKVLEGGKVTHLPKCAETAAGCYSQCGDCKGGFIRVINKAGDEATQCVTCGQLYSHDWLDTPDEYSLRHYGVKHKDLTFDGHIWPSIFNKVEPNK